jgi:drug/metabolite transporter (DMT)-like permease
MILLSGMDAVVKSLSGELTVFQIAFARYAGAAIWLALFIVLTRGTWPNLLNWRRHLLRAALMVMTATSFFYGVTHLPLAIVSALALSAPVYVSLFGILFLKEKPTPTLGVAILLGIAGSLVIVFGGGEPIRVEGSNDFLAWGAALFAPISYAGALVLLKHHADSENSAALSLASDMLAAPLCCPSRCLPSTCPRRTFGGGSASSVCWVRPVSSC